MEENWLHPSAACHFLAVVMTAKERVIDLQEDSLELREPLEQVEADLDKLAAFFRQFEQQSL